MDYSYMLRSPDFWSTGTAPYAITTSTGTKTYHVTYPDLSARASANDMTAKIMHTEILRSLGRKEEADVKVEVEHEKGRYVARIDDTQFLTQDKILITLSAIKGRLMLEIAPIRIKEFRCSMTPETRKNIVAASRRLMMYGKNIPIIASFDEWGNPLPDTIDFGDNASGVELRIVDPAEKGELYLELEAIEFDTPMYSPTWEHKWIYEDDTPF